MITKMEIDSTHDIFCRNDVLNFEKLTGANYVLGGATWLASSPSDIESMTFVSRFVYDVVQRNLSGYQFWLLIGTTALQPDTRITRHKKLWGALKSRGIEIIDGIDAQEVTHELDGGLKFFGAVRLSESSLKSTAKAVMEEHCSYFLASPNEFSIRDLLNIGWSGDFFFNDTSLLAYAAEHEVVLFKPLGEFDDIGERGLGAIGKPQLLEKLLI
ncbi:hypothetical protein [Massilia horti]|uniref:Uncharacterized protein n=1 Tax=Massilia horti TaxID=2562153 RepID=A0A4Y9T8T6_9BURK|nr:hypothetical protein [Massilia horti]TFW34400.1 hypothetical protein E4O92_04150 [Massilia horti]